MLVAALQGFLYEGVCAKDAGIEVTDCGSLRGSRNNPRKEIGNILQLFAICEVFNGVNE